MFLDQKKKIKQLKIQYLEILKTFLSTKKKVIFKSVRVSNFWSNEYESNSDRNKTVLVEKYLNKEYNILTRIYLKGIINILKKFDTWKIELTIANNFIYSIDNDEDCVMHSKSGKIEIVINDEVQ